MTLALQDGFGCCGFSLQRTINDFDRKERRKTSLAFILEGISARIQGNYAQAIHWFHRAIQYEPTFYSSYTNLSGALVEVGELNEALWYADKAIKLFDTERNSPNIFSVEELIDPDKAVEQSKNKMVVNNNKGFVLIEMNRLEEALSYLDAATTAYSTHPIPYINEGKVRIMRGEFSQALTELTKAAQLEPTSAHAHALIGDSYRASGKREAAIIEYEHTIQLVNQNQSEKRAGMGDYLGGIIAAQGLIALEIEVKNDCTEEAVNSGVITPFRMKQLKTYALRLEQRISNPSG